MVSFFLNFKPLETKTNNMMELSRAPRISRNEELRRPGHVDQSIVSGQHSCDLAISLSWNYAAHCWCWRFRCLRLNSWFELPVLSVRFNRMSTQHHAVRYATRRSGISRLLQCYLKIEINNLWMWDCRRKQEGFRSSHRLSQPPRPSLQISEAAYAEYMLRINIIFHGNAW